jgi:hypothetical protein
MDPKLETLVQNELDTLQALVDANRAVAQAVTKRKTNAEDKLSDEQFDALKQASRKAHQAHTAPLKNREAAKSAKPDAKIEEVPSAMPASPAQAAD